FALNGATCLIHDQVDSEPDMTMVEAARRAMAAFQPDVIVSLGGGSVSDVAKVAWFLYERPHISLDEINPFTDFRVATSRLIAIPTTSGSGADVTMGAVITDGPVGRKITLYARDLQPNLTVVDPALVVTLPSQVTADSGLDILSHAVEAYTCVYHNDYSDALALRALQLVFTYLPRAYRDGEDREARERLHNAATIAGLAITNAAVGLAHAMAHVFGGHFSYPHGRIVALFLPYTIEYAANDGGTRYSELALALGGRAESEGAAAASLIRKTRALYRQVNQPQNLAELGLTRRQFDHSLDQLVAATYDDPQLLTTVRAPDREHLRRLYQAAYEGAAIDF
ncbi:MAG: iron-containing alcohol dehydrogenase, partial [Candidatus Promineifilaceae bacterium]|nr:iron-containing alcohol dehydrogenase [Candidatus Promineifilaceae bacterium]